MGQGKGISAGTVGATTGAGMLALGALGGLALGAQSPYIGLGEGAAFGTMNMLMPALMMGGMAAGGTALYNKFNYKQGMAQNSAGAGQAGSTGDANANKGGGGWGKALMIGGGAALLGSMLFGGLGGGYGGPYSYGGGYGYGGYGGGYGYGCGF